MNTRTYRTIIEPDDHGYHGYVPALPGCHTFGLTIEETKRYLREAITGHLASLKQHNEPIPTDDSVESFETFDLAKVPSDTKKSPQYA